MENLQQSTTGNFFSDARNWAKTTTGGLFLGALGLLVAYKILPFLTTIVWEGVSLAIGLAVLGVLITILTSSRFWRLLDYLNTKIAKALTFLFIEWDEFALQEMQIDKAEEDREDMKKGLSSVNGQINEKDTEIAQAKKAMDNAFNMKKQLDIEGVDPNDPEYQFTVSEFARQENFVAQLEPMKQDLSSLAKMMEEVYRQTGFKIKDAYAELNTQKTLLKSYTAGQNVLSKAYGILLGGSELDKDAELAKQMVRQKIANKIGSIKTTMDIIAPIIRERKLQDRAKVTVALEKMKALEIDGQTVQYHLPAPTMISNEYANLIKKPIQLKNN